MTAKVVGNRGAFITGVGGVGAASYPDGSIGRIAVVGKAGDLAYFGASEVHSLDKVQRGYFFQSPAGVTVDFTLADVGLAKNPNPAVQALVPWGNTLTVPAGADIVAATIDGTATGGPIAFSAIRITFVGNGELYIVAR